MPRLENLRYDLSSGLVVFFVALPLCLGIALASGAPFFSGLISGIIGGVVVGFFSKSHVSVSGPAAGLVTIVLAGIETLGTFDAFLLAVLIAGAMQVAMGYAKIGSVAEYFPSDVIRGMLTAIGLIIIIKQIPHALGYNHEFTVLDNDQSLVTNITEAVTNIGFSELVITFVSLAILILANHRAIKKIIGFIPAGLIVVITGIVMAEWFNTIPGWEIAADHRVNVPIANSVDEFLKFFTRPDFSYLTNPDLYIVAFTIAAVASIETLLCIEAADQLDPQRRTTPTNRELKAQGIGNICAGLLGGLPITSVIVRTSANIQAQAKTKLSTIIHGVLLFATAAAIPEMLNRIPLAALAAILLMVGYKLSSPEIFIKTYKKGVRQFAPFIVTIVGIIATDLLMGVIMGLCVSLFIVLRQNLKNSYYYHKEELQEGDKIRLRLSEEVSFLNKAAIRRALEYLPENVQVTIDARSTYYIDPDVIEILEEFKNIKAPQRHIDCIMIGFKDHYGKLNTQAFSVSELAKT